MRVLAASILIVLLAVPAATALPGASVTPGPVDTDLYMHVNGFQDMALSTSPPPTWYTSSTGAGVAQNSACVVDPTGTANFARASHHSWYAFVVPSGVAYDEEVQRPRFYPERGLAQDLELAGDEATLWVTLRIDPGVENSLADPDAPAVVPNVVVRGTLRMGDDISLRHEAYNAGAIIAQNQTPATLLAMDQTQGGHVEYDAADGMHLYTFRVDMPIQEHVVPRADSFNLRIDAFIENPYCDDPGEEGSYIMPDGPQLWSDAEHRPRLTLQVQNPIAAPLFRPFFAGDDFAIIVEASSPWGRSDLLPGDATLADVATVTTDGPAEVPLEFVSLSRTRCHGCATAQAEGTYVWQHVRDATPGIYDIQITVPNVQGTANATFAVQFEVGEGAPKACMGDGPGRYCLHDGQKDEAVPMPWALVVVGLVAAGWLRRR